MLFSLHGTMHHLSRVSFTKAASYCSEMKTKNHDNVELLSMAKLFPKEFPNGTQRSVCHRQYLSTHRLIRQVCGKVETQGPSLEGANLPKETANYTHLATAHGCKIRQKNNSKQA